MCSQQATNSDDTLYRSHGGKHDNEVYSQPFISLADMVSCKSLTYVYMYIWR